MSTYKNYSYTIIWDVEKDLEASHHHTGPRWIVFLLPGGNRHLMTFDIETERRKCGRKLSTRSPSE